MQIHHSDSPCRFQAASLVASPSCPNAVSWSDENFIAVASGHVVTILNPAMLPGPRGLITIPSCNPFSFGTVDRKDLFSGGLLPTCLSRDTRPSVCSISWSPVGLAPNAGCLLAVCTREGRVKLYRFPYREFSAEWVEVMDISEMLHTYYVSTGFGELEVPSSDSYNDQANRADKGYDWEDDQPLAVLTRERKRRRKNASSVGKDSGPQGAQLISSRISEDTNVSSAFHARTAIAEVKLFSYSKLQKGSSVEVLALDGDQRTWVTGMLDQLDDSSAHVIFPATDGNGKIDKWVEINPQFGDHTENDQCPKIRPSMNLSNFPKQLFLGNCNGVEKILVAGQAVEVWTNQRWFEGVFMCLNESNLMVKLSGDTRLISVDATSVRLAPMWNKEKKSWQVTVVRIKKSTPNSHKAVEIKSDNVKKCNQLQVVPVPHSRTRASKKVQGNADRITAVEIKSDNVKKCNQLQVVPVPLSRTRASKKVQGNADRITAAQYVSRSALLSSFVVAWSPVLPIKSESVVNSPYNLSRCCSILAVASKVGRISFWRIHGPQCYSILSNGDPTTGVFIGLLQAHMTWITAISWALFASDSSNPQLILATGSFDGSVKIWQGHSGELLKSSQENFASFSLLKEVIDVDSAPVSALSLLVPHQSQNKIILAVGKGSGALSVWIYDIPAYTFDKFVQDNAHDQIVTGLAWAFDGSCLYSCSQDDSLHGWILHGKSLRKEPIPSNTLGVKSSTDVPNAFDSCFGLAVSPANMAIAVARSFDTGLLNPMYEARSQKAAVEFFWIGGQKLENISNSNLHIDVEAFPDKELLHWGHNMLWSLNQYEHLDKPLVVWDIVAALLAFKQSVPGYVEHILVTWLTSYIKPDCGHSLSSIMPHAPQILSSITSRQLHLLSILSRRVLLSEMENNINSQNQCLEGPDDIEEGKQSMWVGFAESIGKELRERLIVSSFSAAVNLASQPSTDWRKPGCWLPVGLAQMEKWVAVNDGHVKNYLKPLASKVQKLKKRIHSICKYVAEEQCSYCSTSVPFEDADSAFCKGVKSSSGVGQRHKLERCAATMQVCPASSTWFCMCCRRQVLNFAPESHFALARYPTTIDNSKTISDVKISSKPLCPFCGILLQKLQPMFLLSASPV